ncbi:DsbC family protein [uncultured Endozoicomonas sp.]|uniref:DsbC family protein n=1 Tax=uncultured Endozoicomonas sp. TaxID=432652 RepID=UPI00262BF9C3|nr:DsbC family protein [uncultured Endozoicomonas sp.]
MQKLSALLITGLLSAISVGAVAEPDATANKNAETVILKELMTLDSNIPVESIAPSPISGLYEVVLKGGFVLYSSASGKHLIKGEMLEIRDNQLVNLTEEVKSNANAELLAALDKEDMIVFSPEGETKGVVYAFTDVDCGYCRKLHQEVGQMNKLGIELRYLAFPRGGEQSPAFRKMTDAWCTADRKQAMTDLKSGRSISIEVQGDKAACEQIINNQYMLGMQMGVTGTPAMVLENGQVIPGYRPADAIAQMLNIK